MTELLLLPTGAWWLLILRDAEADRERDVAEALPVEDVLAMLRARHGGSCSD